MFRSLLVAALVICTGGLAVADEAETFRMPTYNDEVRPPASWCSIKKVCGTRTAPR